MSGELEPMFFGLEPTVQPSLSMPRTNIPCSIHGISFGVLVGFFDASGIGTSVPRNVSFCQEFSMLL
jgi:hypothetical protein